MLASYAGEYEDVRWLKTEVKWLCDDLSRLGMRNVCMPYSLDRAQRVHVQNGYIGCEPYSSATAQSELQLTGLLRIYMDAFPLSTPPGSLAAHVDSLCLMYENDMYR